MANKPAIVLGAIAAVSIGFASLFYIRYVNQSDQYRALQKENEAAMAEASEHKLISSTLLQQVGELSREKEEAARQSQIRSEELGKDLEKALRAVDLEKSKVSELEVKASGLETQTLNLQKQLTDSAAEAGKYKEEHKYPNSVVDELNKELTGLNDQIKNYLGLKARLEEVEDLYKQEKEDKTRYEGELEAVRGGLESSYALLHKWLEYVDETYLGRVRDRIENLIEDRTHLESIMDEIFDPANIKSGHNEELYYLVVGYIADEQARQRRLEEGPFKPLVEREEATEDLILREQEP
ncbi:MAG: hypothetical protein Q7J54_03030 [Candidatus Woesearchaeota archaeon]|nr:hypothetical protein [Candidatus Woesearchaeota archaeon]